LHWASNNGHQGIVIVLLTCRGFTELNAKTKVIVDSMNLLPYGVVDKERNVVRCGAMSFDPNSNCLNYSPKIFACFVLSFY
jgi:hypothetical protein